MPTRVAVKTDKAPPPLPVYSQAIVCNGMVYCSGQVAMHPETKAMVEGGISDRTVSFDIGSQYSSLIIYTIRLNASRTSRPYLKRPVRYTFQGNSSPFMLSYGSSDISQEFSAPKICLATQTSSRKSNADSEIIKDQA